MPSLRFAPRAARTVPALLPSRRAAAPCMGEGKYGSEVWMFDDNGLGSESRLLIVAVDEDAQAAKIIWEYRLGSHAKIYGDCDPLPSGNVYGSYWRYNYGGDDESQSGVVEVTRDTQRTAWQLKIYGKACPRTGDRLCSVDYLVEGWMMYSVERFYETPLLPSADAGRTGPSAPPTCKNGALEFTVFNSYKESSEKRGAFTLTWTDGRPTKRSPRRARSSSRHIGGRRRSRRR